MNSKYPKIYYLIRSLENQYGSVALAPKDDELLIKLYKVNHVKKARPRVRRSNEIDHDEYMKYYNMKLADYAIGRHLHISTKRAVNYRIDCGLGSWRDCFLLDGVKCDGLKTVAAKLGYGDGYEIGFKKLLDCAERDGRVLVKTRLQDKNNTKLI